MPFKYFIPSFFLCLFVSDMLRSLLLGTGHKTHKAFRSQSPQTPTLTFSFPCRKCWLPTTKCNPMVEVSRSELRSLNGLWFLIWEGLTCKKIRIYLNVSSVRHVVLFVGKFLSTMGIEPIYIGKKNTIHIQIFNLPMVPLHGSE